MKKKQVMCDYWDFRGRGVLSLKTDNTTPDQAFILRVLQMAKSKGADYAF